MEGDGGKLWDAAEGDTGEGEDIVINVKARAADDPRVVGCGGERGARRDGVNERAFVRGIRDEGELHSFKKLRVVEDSAGNHAAQRCVGAVRQVLLYTGMKREAAVEAVSVRHRGVEKGKIVVAKEILGCEREVDRRGVHPGGDELPD